MVSGHCEQQDCSLQKFCIWKLPNFHLTLLNKYISTGEKKKKKKKSKKKKIAIP